MKTIVPLLAAASAAVLLPSIAHADSSPSLGIGLTQTLGGTRGLAARYGRSVQLELVAGGKHYGGWDLDDEDGGYQSLSAAARVHVPLLRLADGWIGAVGGVDVRRNRYSSGGEVDTDD